MLRYQAGKGRKAAIMKKLTSNNLSEPREGKKKPQGKRGEVKLPQKKKREKGYNTLNGNSFPLLSQENVVVPSTKVKKGGEKKKNKEGSLLSEKWGDPMVHCPTKPQEEKTA